jgi:O-antigen ligase
VLRARPDLVDGPLGSSAAMSQGRSAAALILVVCALTGLVHALAPRAALLRLRARRRLVRVMVVVAVLFLAGGAAAANPSHRLNEFRQPPGQFTHRQPDLVRAHLLSGGGSGRWQFWSAALDEFSDRPLSGHGAGSFESWWEQHGSIYYFVRNAHSLYLETLGELGLLGGLLLAAALGCGVVAGVQRLGHREDPGRTTVAALLAAFVAFLVGAGIDWIWQLTVVGAVGVLCLGLLTGPATMASQERVPGDGPRARPRRRCRALLIIIGTLVIAAQGLPWLVQTEIRASQAAVRAGHLAPARRKALAARALQPWASSPRLQLALVDETAGNLAQARTSIREALQRDTGDWSLWFVSARLATEARAYNEAQHSLQKALENNPRSPVLAGTTHQR